MDTTNAERQARWRARRKAELQALRNRAAKASPQRGSDLDDIIGTCDCCAKPNTAVELICKECHHKEDELKTTIAKLRKELAAAKAVTNAPAALAQELATAKARIAELEEENEGLRLHIRFGPKRRPAEPKAAKPPLPPDEARERIIKALRTEIKNLKVQRHITTELYAKGLAMAGGMPRATDNALAKVLHPDQRQHMTRPELDANLDNAGKLYFAWKDSRDKAARKPR